MIKEEHLTVRDGPPGQSSRNHSREGRGGLYKSSDGQKVLINDDVASAQLPICALSSPLPVEGGVDSVAAA